MIDEGHDAERRAADALHASRQHDSSKEEETNQNGITDDQTRETSSTLATLKQHYEQVSRCWFALQIQRGPNSQKVETLLSHVIWRLKVSGMQESGEMLTLDGIEELLAEFDSLESSKYEVGPHASVSEEYVTHISHAKGLVDFVYARQSHLWSMHHYMCKILESANLRQMQKHAEVMSKADISRASSYFAATSAGMLLQPKLDDDAGNVTAGAWNQSFRASTTQFKAVSVANRQYYPHLELHVLQGGLSLLSLLLELADSTGSCIPFYEVIERLQGSVQWIFKVCRAFWNSNDDLSIPGIQVNTGWPSPPPLAHADIMDLRKDAPKNFDFSVLAADVLDCDLTNNENELEQCPREEKGGRSHEDVCPSAGSQRRTRVNLKSNGWPASVRANPSVLVDVFRSSFLEFVSAVGDWTNELFKPRLSEAPKDKESANETSPSFDPRRLQRKRKAPIFLQPKIQEKTLRHAV